MRLSQLVSTPSPTSWAQIFSVDLNPQEKVTPRGGLVVVVELSAPEGFDLAQAGKAVFAEFRQIFDRSTGAFADDLNQALKTTRIVCKEQFLSIQAPSAAAYAVAAAVVIGNRAYLGQGGGACGSLWRRGDLHVILSTQTENELVSGVVEPGDMLVLASSSFAQNVSRDELVAALANGDPEEAVDRLAPKIHAGGADGRAAAAFIQIEPGSQLPETEEQPEQGAAADLPEKADQQLKFTPRSGQRFNNLVRHFRQTSQLIKDRFPKVPLLTGKNRSGIYVRGDETELRRVKMRLGILVLISLLVLSIWQSVIGRRFASPSEETQRLVGQAEQLYREATSLAELNPVRSRDLLKQALGLLEQVELVRGSDWRFRLPWTDRRAGPGRAGELEVEVNKLLTEVARSFEVESDFVFELGSLASGAKGRTMSWVDDLLLVSDPDRGAVYQVDRQTREGKELAAGDQLRQALDAVGELVLTKDAVVRVREKSRLDQVLKSEGRWQKPVAIEIFGANLYILDPAANQIFRYVGLDSGYSSAQSYLKAGAVDLGRALDLAIDGRVWVITSAGEILAFLGGEPEVFLVTGLEQPFSARTRLVTSADLENLYVLDQGNHRIVVLNKSGEYQGQYLNGGLAGAIDLVVDETEGRIWFLRGTRIESIGLK